MELRHLRYFSAVAEAGSFSAAARGLHVSQSSVSEQIADLEHELGGLLLDRSGRQVRLTALGSVFLEEARKTLGAAERAIEVTRGSLRGETGTLSIGFFLWGAGGFFPRIIREFRRRHPGIRLSLFDMQPVLQVQALEEGRLDVGLTRPPEPATEHLFAHELLFRDPMMVVMRPDHPLAGRELRLEDLAGQPMVCADRSSSQPLYDAVASALAERNLPHLVANTSGTWAGVLTLVEAGEGIALVPAGVRQLRTRGLSFSRLRPEEFFLGLAAVWNPRRVGPALEAFLQLLRENKDRIQRTGGAS